jgi:oligoendopeptidase F
MPQKSPYQTLKGLKKKSYLLWCYLHDIEEKFGDTFAECYIQFKQDIRSQFGDLRYKVTWEGFDNTTFLVRYFTSAYSKGWDHLLPLVLEEFLQEQEALACIKDGLERIVQTSPTSAFTEERKLFYAIQEALERQTATGRRSLTTAA